MRFTSIPNGKLHLKFTVPDIKVYGIENPCHPVGNLVSAMIPKGINKVIFHLIFP